MKSQVENATPSQITVSAKKPTLAKVVQEVEEEESDGLGDDFEL